MIEDGSIACAGAFGLGVALHLGLFRVGEWDVYTLTLLNSLVGLLVAQAAAIRHVRPEDYQTLGAAAKGSAALTASLVAGVYTSIVAYRLSPWHRLARFPGPWAARVSTLYMTRRSVRKFHNFEDIRDLHRRYGDVVRVGPSELSIADPAAFSAIHAANTDCVKGPWYNVMHPMQSLQMVRDKKEHSRRRRTWDKGFSAAALRGYEDRVETYADQFLAGVEERRSGGGGGSQKGSASPGTEKSSRPVDMAQWFNFYSFDIMGDLAFGRPFGMLRDGVAHFYMQSAHLNMVLIGAFTRLIWLFPIFKGIPGLNHEYKRFQSWMKGHIDNRIANRPEVPDVFSWIIEDFEKKPNPTWQERMDIYADASLIAVAGSDTTAATLTCMFYQLAAHPGVYARLRDEVDDFLKTPAGSGQLPRQDFNKALASLTYLQAVLDESMRLWPAVPSGVQRMTPSHGLSFGSAGGKQTWIPGDTIVMTPPWTMHRDPRCFKLGDDFIPERWTTRPELSPDPSIYAPFSTGRSSCIGKQLALLEIRKMVVEMVRRYDIAFAPGQDPAAFEAGIKDTFTLTVPSLNLILTPRS